MLTEAQRAALLIDLHRSTEEYASLAAGQLLREQGGVAIVYPPNGGLTTEEADALSQLDRDSIAESAVRKIVADAIARCFIDFFSVVDGVADPITYDGYWPPFELTAAHGATELLHERFPETYWLWRRHRPDPG